MSAVNSSTHYCSHFYMYPITSNGDGNFSIEEVKEIVRDMETAQKVNAFIKPLRKVGSHVLTHATFLTQQAKNMGRLAAAVAVVGLVLCGALLALMFAANEASKEGHVDGSVNVDLKGNPVQTKPLQSFGSLLDFPKLDASVLNEMDYVRRKLLRYKI